MLQLRDVPAHHAGTMTAYLLHNSEKFFPPLNGACTLTNLVLTITAYLHRNDSSLAAAKLPWLGASLALNLATTAWALGIMVPMNKAMARHATSLQANNADEKSEKELRRLQARWQKLNYGMFLAIDEGLICRKWFELTFWVFLTGRAFIMIASSVTALYGLLEDGAILRV